MQKPVFCAITATVAFACCSCGHSPRLYPVSGKVLCKGAPAAGATVFFLRQGGDPMNEHTVMGVVGEEGDFTLVCGSLGQGAPAGEYDVLIEWRRPADRARGPKGPDRLKGHYADRRRPRLPAVVDSRPNHLPPFELTEVDPLDEEPASKTREFPAKETGLFINGKRVDPEKAKWGEAGRVKRKRKSP
jgi:hypothetical protein